MTDVTSRAGVTSPDPWVVGVLAFADRWRQRWLKSLGRAARPLMRQRDVRVALMFSLAVVVALVATLVVPVWLLLLAPLVWGVPHLAADLRYLVIRTEYGSRRSLWLLAGVPLLFVGLGGALAWGFLGAAAVALVARAPVASRCCGCLVMLAGAAVMAGSGAAADVVFAHGHNFFAIALWWFWRPRTGAIHVVPLVLVVAATAYLLLGPTPTLTGIDTDYELWRLAPGIAPELGLRLLLLFCFAQSLHYTVWLRLIPDDDRERSTPPTFRRSYALLRRDFGDLGIAVVVALTLGIAAWSLIDLMAANHGYFRMARFHGHLELMAGILLILERPHAPRRGGMGEGPRGGPDQ